MAISKNEGVDKIKWMSVLVQCRSDRIPHRGRRREGNDEERVERSKEESGGVRDDVGDDGEGTSGKMRR